MKIEIITEDYNESLHGKPWIAKIDISEFPKVVYEWGVWVGTPGNIGVLIIDAEDGDIIARGQDDYQNDRYSIHYFYSSCSLYNFDSCTLVTDYCRFSKIVFNIITECRTGKIV